MRDRGDGRVAMMAAAAEDGRGGRQRQRRAMTAADDNSMQNWAADYQGEWQEWAARDGGDTEWR